MSHAAAPFRRDIEGLRALAVLLVVACHAKMPGLHGGFIGVDVFFVISGYLITRLLLAEWQRQGRIDIAAFYVRRIRRLLPAFALMLCVVTGAIWFVYAPTEQPRQLISVAAAAVYLSNVRYAIGAIDYMAPSAKLDPLLHTWSLGVEEQFYLVWPVLLIMAGLLARRSGNKVLPLSLLLAGIGILSFAACIVLTQTRQPLAFFLPLTRAWEFCLGAAVVLLESRVTLRPVLAAVVAPAALLAILGAAILLTPQSTFPGAAALIPALGAALLILLLPKLAAGNAVARLLAARPLQWVGGLSYGWYLWHWPLLVLGRVIMPGQGLAGDLAMAALALALAQASYVLVEHPTRHSPWLGRKQVAAAGFVLVTACNLLLVLWMTHHAKGLVGTERYQRLQAAQQDMPVITTPTCDGWFYSKEVLECFGGASDSAKTAVLFGDSHAAQWFSALDTITRNAGWRLVLMTKSSCPIVDEDFFYDRIGRIFTECSEWRRAAVEKIRAMHPELVVIASAESRPFTPAQWTAGTERIMAAIAPSSRNVVLLRDTPVPGFNVPDCLARREWNPALAPATCAFDHTQQLSGAVLQALQTAARPYPNVHVIDMTASVCSQTPCEVQTATTIKYRDAGHLTDSFVRLLTPDLSNRLLATGALGR